MSDLPVYPIELISWLDSASINGGLWVDPNLIADEALTADGLTQETVGFLLRESNDALLLIQSVGSDRVGAALSIPKAAVVSRRKLS